MLQNGKQEPASKHLVIECDREVGQLECKNKLSKIVNIAMIDKSQNNYAVYLTEYTERLNV